MSSWSKEQVIDVFNSSKNSSLSKGILKAFGIYLVPILIYTYWHEECLRGVDRILQ